MKFECNMEHQQTQELPTVAVTLSRHEVDTIEQLWSDGDPHIEVKVLAFALHAA